MAQKMDTNYMYYRYFNKYHEQPVQISIASAT